MYFSTVILEIQNHFNDYMVVMIVYCFPYSLSDICDFVPDHAVIEFLLCMVSQCLKFGILDGVGGGFKCVTFFPPRGFERFQRRGPEKGSERNLP